MTLDGDDVLAMPAWQRAAAGLHLVMQYPTEVPGVTLVDVLAEALADAWPAAPTGSSGLLRGRGRRIGFEERFLHRPLNVDLSGGEKKRNETLQLAVLRPKIAILDELDSGLDIDALRDCARRVEAMSNDTQRRRAARCAGDHALQPAARRAAAGPRAHPRQGPDRRLRRTRAGRCARRRRATPRSSPPRNSPNRRCRPGRAASTSCSRSDRRRHDPPVADVIDELKGWLDANWDPDMTVGEWWERLGMAGWSAPSLPAESYGRGVSRNDAVRVAETIADHGALPAPGGLGLLLAAPTIATHGTREQIDHYVADIVTGRKAWCQLFSEPVAGSDLAGLQARAVRDGDEWIVTGQKVWTSSGHVADLGMLIARTDSDVPKHQGISYFAIDMHQPGIEVRPLREMTGRAMFNEVFLTDARVGDDAIIGERNGGWTVANTHARLRARRARVGRRPRRRQCRDRRHGRRAPGDRAPATSWPASAASAAAPSSAAPAGC